MNIIIETFGIAAMLLAVVGVFYNNRMDRRCFWLWMVSNAISCVLHIWMGVWSLVIRDAIFFVLAIQGYRMWANKKIGDDDTPLHQGCQCFPDRPFDNFISSSGFKNGD
jgi:nicotinamide riboside transporter PnuC